MTEPSEINELEAERIREAVAVRAELLRLAEEQGVSPVTNFDELLGESDPDGSNKDSVDDFLRSLQEWRENS